MASPQKNAQAVVEALPTTHNQTPPQAVADSTGHVRNMIRGEAVTGLHLAAKPFYSRGTASVPVTYDGEAQELLIPIRSVSRGTQQRLHRLAFSHVLTPPKRRRTNPQTLIIEEFDDENDPEYVGQLLEQNAKYSELLILHGLDCDLFDADDICVWSGSQHEDRGDEERALTVLRAFGLTPSQYTVMREAIEQLTVKRVEIEAEDTQKKF